jgi:glycosyltransferase involved in cell wall biosynthesis
MKVISLNNTDISGGAARAAYRIHHALRLKGVNSIMRVNVKTSSDWTVEGPKTKIGKAMAHIRRHLGGLLTYLLKTDNKALHSPAILYSNLYKELNKSDADIVHLHWINGEVMSIRNIGKINKPIVWTLHDMWAFSGCEHYSEEHRWRDGYYKNNRPGYELGFDLNRWTWNRKKKAWKSPIQIVTPSTWLANCARQSPLMKDWPITVIPNAVDTDVWKPVNQFQARELLNLPQGVPILLFGAIGGSKDYRKGFDLLLESIEYLHGNVDNLRLLVVGELRPKTPINFKFPVDYVEHLHDDLSMRVVYSAADVLVNPARQEAFGQTASEAHACGTPVVAFDNSGLADIVMHKHTGYLATAFDAKDMAQGILWVLQQEIDLNSDKVSQLSKNARKSAIERFSYPIIAKQYLDVYSDCIACQHE